MAQAKPRATSTGALTAPTFEPSQHLSVTPFSALTAEESSDLGANWADQDRLSQNYFVKLDQDLGTKWKFQAQVTEYLANADLLESSTYYSVDPKTGEGAGVWGAKEAWDTDATGVDLYTTGPIKIFGREHQVMAGANGYQNSLVGRLH